MSDDCFEGFRFAEQHDPNNDWLPLHRDIVVTTALMSHRWRVGVLFRFGSVWIGAHWSRVNRRLCINLIPFVTIWVTAPGGVMP
jgi:hypothetical protein